MEFCEGMELFDAIIERGRFTEPDAKPVFRQISAALAHLHALNIVHRDVKPENIQLCRTSGLVKLLDFGLSKIIDVGGSEAKTQVGHFVRSTA